MTPPNTTASECRGDRSGASLKETGIQLFSNCHFKRTRRERGLEGILKENDESRARKTEKKKTGEDLWAEVGIGNKKWPKNKGIKDGHIQRRRDESGERAGRRRLG